MATPKRSPEPADLETVRKIAQLARLDIRGAEAEELAAQFARILEHFQVLARLDVSGVEAMLGASRASNVLRDDLPRPSLPVQRVLASAPARIDDFYSVPRTVGGDE